VVIDVGNVHERPTAAPTVSFPPVKTGPPKHEVNIEAERAALLAADQSLAESSAARGFEQTFMENAVEDVRFYRMNAFPVVGKSAVHAILADWTGELTWQPAAADVSQSGDLGYTYGVAEYRASEKPVESSSYLRIWQKSPDGQWLVVLEIINPIPPSQTASN
jgi:ketosteroid isomerase-like protein